MAGHTVFTGKSGPTSVTYGGASIPTGWQMITITENGKPIPEQLDKTDAGDAAYSYMDDPLGGKGQANCSIDIEGMLSVTDHQDTGLLATAIDATEDLIVTTGTTSDMITVAQAAFKGMHVGDEFAKIQPYKATFTLASSAGVWSTAA